MSSAIPSFCVGFPENYKLVVVEKEGPAIVWRRLSNAPTMLQSVALEDQVRLFR